MNLDELQSVQARERQSSDLQHLRPSFYAEVGEYIRELQAERAQVVDRADDPFSSPEVRRLSDDIETAEQTVEAIYERRVGKVVKKASIAAAGMPVEDDGLTNEEEALFDDLVARIQGNRETVLAILDGDAPSVSCSIDEGVATDASAAIGDSTPDGASLGSEPTARSSAVDSMSEPPTPDVPSESPTPDGTKAGVNAADLMGGGSPTDQSDGDAAAPAPPNDTADDAAPPTVERVNETPTDAGPSAAESTAVESSAEPTVGTSATEGTSAAEPERHPVAPSSPPPEAERDDPRPTDADSSDTRREVPGIPRTTVRITADIGEMVGADDRDYHLGNEDVVTLPESTAAVLVSKNAAEPLE